MIMKDYITSEQRLVFKVATNEDFYNRECAGCGRDCHQIVKEDSCTYEDLEWESKTEECGLWYCHTDCYRDSR
ncbi:MAG TPA: hypothetical protein VGJ00_10390 [Rhabdochlamydiaceae bacterium]|jgi:hypothetical protein